MSTLYKTGIAIIVLMNCFSGHSKSIDSPMTRMAMCQPVPPSCPALTADAFDLKMSATQLILSNPGNDTISIKMYNESGELVVVAAIATAQVEISLDALPQGKYYYFMTNHKGIRLAGHVNHTITATKPTFIAGPGLFAQ